MKGTLDDPVRVMRRALKFASRDAARPILCAVHLDESGDVVATDTYRLFAEGAWDGPSVDIDFATAYDIAHCKVKGNDSAVIEYVGGKLVVRMADGTEIAGAIAEGSYPNYRKLLDGAKPKAKAWVPVKQVTPILKAHAKGNVRVDVFGRDVVVSGVEQAEPACRFDKAADGEDAVISLNADYLRDAVSVMGEHACIGIEASTKPAVVSNGDGIEVLVMPVRMDYGKPKAKVAKGMRAAPKSQEPEIKAEVGSLEGERVCITGTLPTMTRGEAFSRLRLAGGIPCERFTSKVTLLVIAADSGRSKREKAEKAIAKGQKVRIVNGTEFTKALMEQGKTAGERKKEEHMAKKQETRQDKPITVECFGRKFYASHERGKVIHPGGESAGVSFEVGKAYRYRESGHEYAAASLGYDVYKGQKKCLFAVFEDGEWKGYLRTMAWAKLKALANNPIDEQKKLTPPPVKAEKKETPAAPKPPAKKATEKKEDTLDKRIEELEKQLKETRAELEQVWKENETLKKAKGSAPKAPKPAKAADKVAEVSLETMQEWCEGKNLLATQKREGACIWVEGESTPYKDELVEMGFRFAKKRKSWYLNPAA